MQERRGLDVTPAWRIAALPALAWLGAVLPLAFIPQLGDFLYYLRPIELFGAYGTAWLLLAALALPAWALATLALAALGACRLHRTRRGLAVALGALALAAAAAAFVYCLIIWLQTFGAAFSFRAPLRWGVLAAGFIAGCTVAGHRLVERLRAPMRYVTLFGALCALALPLFAWRDAGPAVTAASAGARPGARSAPATSGSAAAAGAAAAPADPPNIVLLTMDALSAEHMSLYGAARPTTPQLAAFAQKATTFEHAFANGNYTTPGIASILTGTRPWTNRALQLQSWPIAVTRRESLPAVLRRAGYQLGYVSTNPAAGADKNGLGGYFQFSSRDRIQDVSLCSDTLSSTLKYACPVASMPLFGSLMGIVDDLRGPTGNAHYDPQLAIAPALAWLQRVPKRRPVFLWVHLFPPHAPYASPAPWLGRFDASPAARTPAETEPYWDYTLSRAPAARVRTLEARYDESIAYVDHYAGSFLQRALQLLGPDTVVVVTSDHGESFHHGYGAHTGPGLYDEIIHVPLIIRLPRQQQPIRYPGAVEQVDIAPTLAQLAGIAAPAIWEGRSLLPAWSHPADPMPARPVFSMNFEQSHRHGRLTTGSVAVIESGWKLVHYIGHPHYPDMPALHDELYDLTVDPRETNNLATRDPGRVRQLRQLIDTALARHGRAR